MRRGYSRILGFAVPYVSHRVGRTKGGFMSRVISYQDDIRQCTFCGKTERQVRKLVAGPGVAICEPTAESSSGTTATIAIMQPTA